MPSKSDDGYRYMREERTYASALEIAMGAPISSSRFALYERQDGRAVRVGTATTYGAALDFLASSGQTVDVPKTRSHGRRNGSKAKG